MNTTLEQIYSTRFSQQWGIPIFLDVGCIAPPRALITAGTRMPEECQRARRLPTWIPPVNEQSKLPDPRVIVRESRGPPPVSTTFAALCFSGVGPVPLVRRQVRVLPGNAPKQAWSWAED